MEPIENKSKKKTLFLKKTIEVLSKFEKSSILECFLKINWLVNSLKECKNIFARSQNLFYFSGFLEISHFWTAPVTFFSSPTLTIILIVTRISITCLKHVYWLLFLYTTFIIPLLASFFMRKKYMDCIYSDNLNNNEKKDDDCTWTLQQDKCWLRFGWKMRHLYAKHFCFSASTFFKGYC